MGHLMTLPKINAVPTAVAGVAESLRGVVGSLEIAVARGFHGYSHAQEEKHLEHSRQNEISIVEREYSFLLALQQHLLDQLLRFLEFGPEPPVL